MKAVHRYSLSSLVWILLLSACKDKSEAIVAHPVQKRWTIVSRTGTFPGNTSLNFVETASPGDYLDFRLNDSAYAYYSPYLPFGKDTAHYTINGTQLFFTDHRQYGIIFQHQNNQGVMLDTTTATIVSVTDSTCQLRFPTVGTVSGTGGTVYFPGTLLYRLRQ
jgi:hypothetical protein